jgi:hypothetical protein
VLSGAGVEVGVTPAAHATSSTHCGEHRFHAALADHEDLLPGDVVRGDERVIAVTQRY